MSADLEPTGLKKPIVIIAFNRAELAERRAAEVPGLVEMVLNYKRAHGDPEEVCNAYRPSLTTTLGAWWDEHFTCTETMTEAATDAETARARYDRYTGGEVDEGRPHRAESGDVIR
jgi:hypothetical protein